jgi:hypothetical protein
MIRLDDAKQKVFYEVSSKIYDRITDLTRKAFGDCWVSGHPHDAKLKVRHQLGQKVVGIQDIIKNKLSGDFPVFTNLG